MADYAESRLSREERARKDFEFFVLCHAKGNPAMYELLRDRDLDKPFVEPSDDIEHSG